MELATDDVLTIDDVVFWGGYGDEGFFIDREGFEGWEDSPDVRFERLDRAATHGEFDSPSFYGARTLTVTGKCQTTSAEKLGEYGARLRALLVGKKRAVVRYQGAEQYADGRLASQVLFRTVRPGREARFQFSLRFPDPRKYGETRVFTSGSEELVDVWHRGNFVAAPVMVVSGAAPGYSITAGALRYEVTAPVEPGKPHTVDMATGQVTFGGLVRYGVIGQADTVTVPAGVQRGIRVVPTSGSLSMVTKLKDTSI